jgi:hypothetical protein
MNETHAVDCRQRRPLRGFYNRRMSGWHTMARMLDAVSRRD